MPEINLDDIIPYDPSSVKPRKQGRSEVHSFSSRHPDLQPFRSLQPNTLLPSSSGASDFPMAHAPRPQEAHDVANRMFLHDSHEMNMEFTHTELFDKDQLNTCEEQSTFPVMSSFDPTNRSGGEQDNTARSQSDIPEDQGYGTHLRSSYPCLIDIESMEVLSHSPFHGASEYDAPSLLNTTQKATVQTEKSSSTDQALMRDERVRAVDATVGVMNGAISTDDKCSPVAEQGTHSPKLASRNPHPAENLISKEVNSVPLQISEETTGAETNIIPLAIENQRNIGSAQVGSANPENECDVCSGVACSVAVSQERPSPQSVSSPLLQSNGGLSPRDNPETDVELRTSPGSRSLQVNDGGLRRRTQRFSAPNSPNVCLGKRRVYTALGESSDGSNGSDDDDDEEDEDYVDEAESEAQRRRITSRTGRQAKRTAPPVRTPIQYEATTRPTTDTFRFEMPKDLDYTGSPRESETIPVQGFLTRDVFLSKAVYSFTFEEQRPNGDFQEREEVGIRTEVKKNNNYSRDSKPQSSQAHKSAAGTRYSGKDDRLLIELREKRNLPWKRIAEYFPGRSKGSLEVRYYTRVKARAQRSFGHRPRPKSWCMARNTSKASRHSSGLRVGGSETVAPQILSRDRYGPRRTRRAVDRYSPV